MSYEEEDTCASYEEEDTCVSYEEEDTAKWPRRSKSQLSGLISRCVYPICPKYTNASQFLILILVNS